MYVCEWMHHQLFMMMRHLHLHLQTSTCRYYTTNSAFPFKLASLVSRMALAYYQLRPIYTRNCMYKCFSTCMCLVSHTYFYYTSKPECAIPDDNRCLLSLSLAPSHSLTHSLLFSVCVVCVCVCARCIIMIVLHPSSAAAHFK
jgi:hypothetical protein